MNNKKKHDEEFDVERMKIFRSFSLEQKLEYLEERAKFLDKMLTGKQKQIRLKLKEEGF